jgi:hypothetical protein
MKKKKEKRKKEGKKGKKDMYGTSHYGLFPKKKRKKK